MVLPKRKEQRITKDSYILSVSNPHLDDIDNISITDDDDGNTYSSDVAVDLSDVTPQMPHFLDYDAVAPQGLEGNFDKTDNGTRFASRNEINSMIYVSGEQLRVDKRFEKDGEISDYELAACGYTKKEFTQDDNIALPVGQKAIATTQNDTNSSAFVKRKHFLDENPIPPDYMLKGDIREHRSLDRCFDRQQQDYQRSVSASSTNGMMNERKSSLDREMMNRSSRGKIKEPSYTLSRFIESESVFVGGGGDGGETITPIKNEKYLAWSDSVNSFATGMERYSRLHCPTNEASDTNSGDTYAKVECVYSLLSMLGSNNSLEMSKKFFELSRTSETCATLRRSGCIPLLVQMMQSDSDDSVRKCSSMALYNVVHSNPDEKCGRRELKVLRLIEQIMDYCNFLKTLLQSGGEAIADDSDRHPLAAISSLMKVSFDEEHRHAMCQLGALQAIPNLVHLDHAVHGPKPEDQCCNSLRRYALMALTNLTFGDENNKAFLCSQKFFMEALVSQLESAPDDLLQGTASVLRNLSWRADSNMKAVLNEIGTVTALAKAAMKNKSENTLKAILSALWNLSAHCSTNKAEFCSVEGALAFLVDMLTYEGPSKTLKIIENAGGILRNVSSHIAVREDYRQILRERNCLSILLQQLKSESLTVVSNSCGTLWNLSARCPEDQKFLWDNGAVPMLRSLIHSKHNMISEGSSSALKNLLNFRPSVQNQNVLDPITKSMGLKKLPTLNARKQKALEDELSSKNLNETCDNLDVTTPKDCIEVESDAAAAVASASKYPAAVSNRLTRSAMLSKSESKDSIFSVKSDSVYEKMIRNKSLLDTGNVNNSSPSGTRNKHIPFNLQNENVSSEIPIDYSAKYKEKSAQMQLNLCIESASTQQVSIKDEVKSPNIDHARQGKLDSTRNYSSYQETDLDQPTDFSLRYAENHLECDADDKNNQSQHQNHVRNGNEMILVLEDSVKCYQTEDTPYVISNAASVSDLRNPKSDVAESSIGDSKKTKTTSHHHQQQQQQHQKHHHHHHHSQSTSSSTTTHAPGILAYGSGSYTPEKPINYCEEGTPGYFSRYESLSSLEESPQGISQQASKNVSTTKSTGDNSLLEKTKTSSNEANLSIPVSEEIVNVKVTSDVRVDSTNATATSSLPIRTVATSSNISANYNSAQETPLMFSRRSSMDSLAEEDVEIEADGVVCDDKSSVVSDFSRLASGVVSPSDIPDSPTQTMSHSPRRNIHVVPSPSGIQRINSDSQALDQKTPPNTLKNRNTDLNGTKYRLRSVFEDGVNTFQVENTPAQFSSATSLSNLSLDEEANFPETATISTQLETISASEQKGAKTLNVTTISEGEEDTNNDDLLLATCINIGMNRNSIKVSESTTKVAACAVVAADITTQYCTEDTPALSEVASITNLSAFSNNSAPLENRLENAKGNNCHDVADDEGLSDNVSSNVSECADGGNGAAVLQQCIREGIQKLKSRKSFAANTQHQDPIDPIEMMRRGGNILFPTAIDETNKFVVEDSPCNFSVISGLSNLTVGSVTVGPANIKIESSSSKHTKRNKIDDKIEKWQDDSLSSLSVDSEDDSNLLCQAIAAGCNRPKSNIGFNTNKKSSSSLFSQQQSTSAAGSSSLTTISQQQHQLHYQSQANGNDSISSIDSSDSNDNQSKSLFEFCIRTGMHKQTTKRLHTDRGTGQYRQQIQHNNHAHQSRSSRSNSNLNVDSLLLPQQQQKPRLDYQYRGDREQKDELLLMECINKGMSKSGEGGGGVGGLSKSKKPPASTQTSSRHKFTEPNVSSCQSHLNSKNVQSTSAAALGQYRQPDATTSQSAPNIVPDVEMKCSNVCHEGTGDQENQSKRHRQVQQDYKTSNRQQHQVNLNQNRVNVSENENPIMIIGSKKEIVHKNCGKNDNSVSFNDNNTRDSNDSFPIEFISIENRQNGSSIVKTTELQDKHKDPDLMMKSVERLTLDFVSTAELLRTAANNAAFVDSNSTEIDYSITQTTTTTAAADDNKHGMAVGKNSSNNTWNENTCPNDVSFPSVSITAPMVASITDNFEDEELTTFEDDIDLRLDSKNKEINDFTEITPTNEPQSLNVMLGKHETDEVDFDGTKTSQPNSSLGTVTECNGCPRSSDSLSQSTANEDDEEVAATTNGINFLVGGEVQSSVHAQNHNSYFLGSDASTAIAMEANKLAENFKDYQNSHSIDLDNIRPPSCMDSLSTSGYFDSITPRTPQLTGRQQPQPMKPIPAGIVARRAVGNFSSALHGSLESINSSCNLDNIKPPSLMDELLDSMLSVASIQSEIVDISLNDAQNTLSNYETAAAGINGNDSDDNTFTLRSCNEVFPRDEESNDCISISSDFDFSSADSTPRKNSERCGQADAKKMLTPKEKRKMVKDRFKTYTITTDIELNKANILPNVENNETLQVEIEEEDKTVSIKQINLQNCERFQTQTINYRVANELEFDETEVQMPSNKVDIDHGDSLTSADDYSDDICSIKDMTKNFKFINTSDEHVNATAATESDYNSMDCDQNSETESCSGQNKSHSDNDNETNLNNENISIRPRIIKPVDKDSGTDLNVSEDVDNQTIVTQVKAVRGRKKGAYISPYRISLRNSTTIAKVVNITETTIENISEENIVQSRKKNINIREIAKKFNQSKSTLTKGRSSPNILREGTFVKDEPANTDGAAGTVVSKSSNKLNSSSPSKLPTKVKQKSAFSSKIKAPARFSSSSVTMLNTAAGSEKYSRLPGFTGIRKSTTVPSLPQRSNSNSSIHVSPTVCAAIHAKRLSSTTPSSRSNSNLTTNATINPLRSTSKISQTQSRIANLWKRVDDVKTKQQQKALLPPASKGGSSKANLRHAQVTQPKLAVIKNQKISTTSITATTTTTTACSSNLKTQLKSFSEGERSKGNSRNAVAVRK